jgi:hypothetical protein
MHTPHAQRPAQPTQKHANLSCQAVRWHTCSCVVNSAGRVPFGPLGPPAPITARECRSTNLSSLELNHLPAGGPAKNMGRMGDEAPPPTPLARLANATVAATTHTNKGACIAPQRASRCIQLLDTGISTSQEECVSVLCFMIRDSFTRKQFNSPSLAIATGWRCVEGGSLWSCWPGRCPQKG